MRNLVIFTCSFVILSISCFAQNYIDIVQLKDGKVIECTIIEQIPNKSLTIKKLDGVLETIEYDKIEKISKKDMSYVDIRNKAYTELGLNTGTPGLINILIGRWFGPFGISVSGISLGYLFGIQGNLRYKLSDNYKRCHSINTVIGYSYADVEKTGGIGFFWTNENKKYEAAYYGLAYNLNWGGYWLEIGLAAGYGYSKHPLVILQLGYAHRFLD